MDQEFESTMPNRLRRPPKDYAGKSPCAANTANTDEVDNHPLRLDSGWTRNLLAYLSLCVISAWHSLPRSPTGHKKPKVSLALVNSDEGRFGKNVFAGFTLDIAVGRFLARSKMIDRKSE
jgi:hypothetical protein